MISHRERSYISDIFRPRNKKKYRQIRCMINFTNTVLRVNVSCNGGRCTSGEFSKELYEATNSFKTVLLTINKINVNLDSVASSQDVKIKVVYTYIQSGDIRNHCRWYSEFNSRAENHRESCQVL